MNDSESAPVMATKRPGRPPARKTPSRASKRTAVAPRSRRSAAPQKPRPAGADVREANSALAGLKKELRAKQREYADALVLDTVKLRDRHERFVTNLSEQLAEFNLTDVIEFLAMDAHALTTHIRKLYLDSFAVAPKKKGGELRTAAEAFADGVVKKLVALQTAHESLLVKMDKELAEYGIDSALIFLAMDRETLREHMFRYVRGEAGPPPKRPRIVLPKYVHPVTGEHWAGRGMSPMWVREWEEAHGNRDGITVRYRHPDEVKLVWAGHPARKPEWVKAWLESGRSIKELKVDNS